MRKKLRLTGTKLGCAEGGCGACTVMISKYIRKEDKIIHYAINACLAPVCSMHGLAITTVEGIGSTKTKLHPVQERIAKSHGSQCGFCTPGIVMSMYSLLRSSLKVKYSDLEVAFQGNLCRCTGYRAIIEGYKSFAEDSEEQQVDYKIKPEACAMGVLCCKNNTEDNSETIYDRKSFVPYDASQEPIFPPELKLNSIYDEQFLIFRGINVTWYRPTELETLVALKEKYPDAKIVVGNTEVGIEIKFKHFLYPIIIMPNLIPELNKIIDTDSSLIIGAAVTFREIENVLIKVIDVLPQYKTRALITINKMLHYFAGRQIRNVASIGGNIMTGSPVSDLNPMLMALKAKLKVISENGGQRIVRMNETFFTGYRRNCVKNDEVLLHIEIPYTTEFQYTRAYKQAKRRDDDISIVTTAINVTFENDTDVIKEINIALGGMAEVTRLATKTNKSFKGVKWNEGMLGIAYENLLKDFPLEPSAPGGNVNYRKSLIMSLYLKTYLSIAKEMSEHYLDGIALLPKHISGGDQFRTKLPKSSQYFDLIDHKQVKSDAVGRPIVHRSALQQTTGEAIYCDDMPTAEGELYLGFVLSAKSHAKLIAVDASNALEQNGVVAFFSAKDLTPKQNKFKHDEEIFASEKVTSQGQVIGVIVANDQIIAKNAAKLVNVVYEELSPIIVTIEDAIKYNSYHSSPFSFPLILTKGDIKAEFENKNNFILENEYRISGQEHFYLQTQVSFAIPKKEDDEMEIFCPTQHPSEISQLISHMLNIPINRLVIRVKRIGGGFGGKETQTAVVALPVAFSAYKLNRPVRCMLDRNEDMMMTGGRHPFLIKHKVAFSKEGKILAADIKMYNNGGYSCDLSQGVMSQAILNVDNAYFIPNLHVTGHVCKTNLPSNTAFRGFGSPQTMFGMENVIRDIANALNKRPEEITKMNLYEENQTIPCGQTIIGCTIQRCWDECVEKSDLAGRKKEVELFNRNHRWRKRGVAIVPTKYGIGISEKISNRAGALVLIYADGSVLLSHGGCEMGQGLHTKMIQVASRALGIDISKIHISETSTDKVPNTFATAASVSSDLNGMAVSDACEKLNKLLRPYKDMNPKGTWEEWISAANSDRVSLSATGFYATPDIGYDFKSGTGNPFTYFTFGVASAEVEIDCLSGDHQVIRCDIVMDLGSSLNPAIDIGQIEGAFMQGYGLFTMEELIYSPTGTLYSRGPGTYKIPGFGDVPLEFNVSLLKGSTNPRAIYSSKAVGEPPLFLSSSIFFAIKEAIKAARADAGVPVHFRLDSPATAARIRIACSDHITKKLEEPDPSSYVPWNVIP